MISGKPKSPNTTGKVKLTAVLAAQKLNPMTVALDEFQLINLVDHRPALITIIKFDGCHNETIAGLDGNHCPPLSHQVNPTLVGSGA